MSNDFFSNMNQFHLLRLLSSHSTQREHCILTCNFFFFFWQGKEVDSDKMDTKEASPKDAIAVEYFHLVLILLFLFSFYFLIFFFFGQGKEVDSNKMDAKEAPSKDEIAVGYFHLVLLLFFFPFYFFTCHP